MEQDLKANDRCDVGGSSGILRKKTCCIKNAAKFLHFCKRYQPFCLRNICVCEIFEKGMKAHVLHGTAIFTFIYLHEKLTFPVNLRRKRCVFFGTFFQDCRKKETFSNPSKLILLESMFVFWRTNNVHFSDVWFSKILTYQF